MEVKEGVIYNYIPGTPLEDDGDYDYRECLDCKLKETKAEMTINI